MVAFNVTGAVIFVSVFYWWGPDHSWLTLVRWAMLFLASLVFPTYLSAKVEAELAKLPPPVSPRLGRAAVYPVWVGIFTLGAAIALLGGLR
jgi:hypothetical protein